MPKRILITGATSGIGLALARIYQAKGERPLLLGRKPWADLAELQDEFSKQDYFQVDLAQSGCVHQLAQQLIEQEIDRLDMVIHNAGVGFYGPFAEQTPENIHQLIAINLVAPISLTHALLPWLPAGKGQIVFISSVVADLPGPDYAVYAATKAALSGFARSLRMEWQGDMLVQLIHPGATRTRMHEKMGMPTNVMDWQKFPPTQQVATEIAKVIAGKRPFVTIGMNNKVLGLAGRQFGAIIDPAMRRKENDKNMGSAPLRENDKPICVITGAADGIGKALAFRFAQAGFQICGIDVDAAHTADTVAEMRDEGADVSFVIADLSTDAGIKTAVSKLLAGPPIDVFIHNAGISAVGPFAELPLARQLQVVDVNLRAPLWLTAVLEANGKLKRDGSLVFLSSLSKFVGYPGAAVYAATKDGLAAYARSIRVALGNERHVLTVYPGPTRTAHARRYSPDNGREARRQPPEELADGIYQAMAKRRTQYIPGAGNQLFATAGKLFPGLVNQVMKKTLYDSLDGKTFI